MKVLHILKTEPDEIVELLTAAVSKDNQSSVTVLYQEDVNWDGLVDDIFSYDKVISWW